MTRHQSTKSSPSQINRSVLAIGLFIVSVPLFATERSLSLRLPQTMETSANTITIVDREMIDAIGALTIGEALRGVPGILVGHRNAGNEAIAFQGISDEFPRRTQILLNGRSIYLPTSGGVTWRSLPVQIADVERIEVIHGPNMAVSGSNALLGTINIVTKRATEVGIAEARITQGSNRENQTNMRLSGAGDAFAGSLSIHANSDKDGYDSKDDQYPFKDNFNTVGGVMRIDGNLGKLREGWGDIGLEIGASQSKTDLGGYVDPWKGQPGLNEHDFTNRVEQNYQHLTWNKQAWDGVATLRLSRMEETTSEQKYFPLPGLGDLPYDNGYKGVRYDLDADYGQELSQNLQWMVGLGLRRDEVISDALLTANSPQSLDTVRGFLQVDWKPDEDWMIAATLASEYHTLTDSQLAPSLAINYSASKHHHLRLGYAEGYRQPMAYEVLGDKRASIPGMNEGIQFVLASGNLVPEYNRTLDFAWTFSPDKRFSSSMRVYISRLDDLIAPYLRPYEGISFHPGHVLDFENSGSLDLYGIESSLKWRWEDWIVYASYTWTRTENNNQCSQGAFDLCNAYQNSRPENNLSLLVSKRLGDGWNASVQYQYVSDYQWMWVTYPVIEDGHYLSASLSKKWSINNHDIEAKIMGKNLLGDVHDFRSDAAWEPAIYLQIGIGSY